MQKLYWIETISTHRMCYAVESETKPDIIKLEKRINDGTIIEIGQKWQGEEVDLIREITHEDFLELFNTNASKPYVEWDEKTKLEQITNLDEAVKLEEENG